MGKRKQKGGKNDGNVQKRHKAKSTKHRRCWIESCKDNKFPQSGCSNGSLTIHISRVELTDDHTHGGSGADLKLSACRLDKTNEVENKSLTRVAAGDEGNENTTTEIAAPTESDTILNKTPEINTNTDKDVVDQETLGNEEMCNNVKDLKSNGPMSSLPTVSEKENAVKPDFSKAFVKTSLTPSAKGNLKWFQMNKKGNRKKRNLESIILPNGDCGDGVCNPFPKDEVPDKYWAQRKRFFRKFDEGIQLDKESWYSVTPEAIASHLGNRMANFFSAQNCKSESNGLIVLDAFCGCGGNAIGFAKEDNISLVICVDIDRNKLRKAAHNANIYGINPDKIRFIVSNALDVMESYSDGDLLPVDNRSEAKSEDQETVHGFKIGSLRLLPKTIDAIFLSPPWGGPDYLQDRSGYKISSCIKISKQMGNDKDFSNEQKEDSQFVNGEDLLEIAAKSADTGRVMYFLPRNIDGVSLGRSALKAGYRNDIELEQNYLNGKLKTVTAYFGGKI